MTDPLPLTVVTGYLGAGKTTLLNNVLTQPHGRRYAVIVNEFGEIGIDGMLFTAAEDDLFEMSNGCVCCTVRSDLSEAFERILTPGADFDGIILETSGLAQPAPIIQTLLMDEKLRGRVVMDSVVTLVDAPSLAAGHVFEPTQAEQLAFADVIVLTKTDLGTGAADLMPLRIINAHAPIVHSGAGGIPIDQVIGLAGFDPTRRLGQPARASHSHDSSVTSVSLRVDGRLDSSLFMDWVTNLVDRHADTLLRLKGVIRLSGEPRPFVVQGVRTLLDGGFQPLGARSELGENESCLVLIGSALDADALAAGFTACISQEGP